MFRYATLGLIFLLAGCGAETASTATTVSASKAEEAKQADNAKDVFQQQIDAAMIAGKHRLENTEKKQK